MIVKGRTLFASSLSNSGFRARPASKGALCSRGSLFRSTRLPTLPFSDSPSSYTTFIPQPKISRIIQISHPLDLFFFCCDSRDSVPGSAFKTCTHCKHRYTSSAPGHCDALQDGKYSWIPIYIWAFSSNLTSERFSPNWKRLRKP